MAEHLFIISLRGGRRSRTKNGTRDQSGEMRANRRYFGTAAFSSSQQRKAFLRGLEGEGAHGRPSSNKSEEPIGKDVAFPLAFSAHMSHFKAAVALKPKISDRLAV